MAVDFSRLNASRILVSGGAGFIGSNLAIKLIEAGADVRVLDNLSTGRLSNLEGYENDVELIIGDIGDDDAIKKALKGIDIVFHEAALPSVARSLIDPMTTDRVNSEGTLHILLAAREAGIDRLVYASSSSIYGDSMQLPKEESMPPNPMSPYALSKYCGERHCQLSHKIYGLEAVALRYFNVFGPRQDPSSQYAAVIPKFITSILKGEKITIYGDGKQTRDFTYIDNVVNTNVLAAFSRDVAGEVINVACGQQISVVELAEFLMQSLQRRVEIEWAEPRAGEVRDSLASIAKAEAILSYRPEVDVWEGLEKTISWYTDKMDGN